MHLIKMINEIIVRSVIVLKQNSSKVLENSKIDRGMECVSWKYLEVGLELFPVNKI